LKKRTNEQIEDNTNETLKRARKLGESVRNIGKIPPVKNPERRADCEFSLSKFILTYSPIKLNPFSEDHFRVIKIIETCVFDGGLFIEAVYRSFGKSTIAEFAIVWINCYGHKHFSVIASANGEAADERLAAIKTLFTSQKIAEDFPEIAYPVERLEGIAQRARGQMFEDDQGNVRATGICWSGSKLILADTGGKNSGNIIVGAGITSSKVRGAKHLTDDGQNLRPDFYLVDDPQDEESAVSKNQINKRKNIIIKGIIKSAGLTESLALVMPCTVIAKDDLIDQLLDSERYPAFMGERIKFVRQFADAHENLWLDEYAKIRNTYDRTDSKDKIRERKAATEFYIENREAMDKGSDVAWEWGFKPGEDEISSIQHAYNFLIDFGLEAFMSEYQNDPEPPAEDNDGNQIETTELNERCITTAKSLIPMQAEKLTAFIDVQGKCLYWMVCAFRADFSVHIVDYGCFPDQNLYYFTLKKIKTTLFDAFPGCGQEAAWRKGFDSLCNVLCEKEFIREDKASMRISRLLIDANEGQASKTVYDYCQQSKHAAVVMPARGRGVTASMKPFSDYRRAAGDVISPYNWRIPSLVGTSNTCRYILSDINFWKSFTRSRIKTAVADPGALTIYGKPENHQMLIEQLCSEYSVTTSGRGRTVDEWKLRQFSYDNHLWDCLVGCIVGASEQKIELGGAVAVGQTTKKRSRMDRLAALGKVRQ